MPTLGLNITSAVNTKLQIAADMGITPTEGLHIYLPPVGGSMSRNPQQWARGFDLTPILYGHGTVIARDCYLVNEHLIPANGSTAEAYSMTGVQSTRTVISSQKIGLNNGIDGFKTDLAVVRVNSDFPAAIGVAQVLPINYHTYILFANGVPAIQIDGEQKTLLCEWIQVDAWFVYFRKSGVPNWQPYYEPLVSGDSSHGSFVVVNQKLCLIESHSVIGGGPDVARNTVLINQAMTKLGSSYQLTVADLSGFALPTPPAPPLAPPGPISPHHAPDAP